MADDALAALASEEHTHSLFIRLQFVGRGMKISSTLSLGTALCSRTNIHKIEV
jgi:hypothetical protein